MEIGEQKDLGADRQSLSTEQTVVETQEFRAASVPETVKPCSSGTYTQSPQHLGYQQYDVIKHKNISYIRLDQAPKNTNANKK